MSRRLKNVTVTLDPTTARWARVEAARRDMSVSRLIGEMLEVEMRSRSAYEEAMARYMERPARMHEPGTPHLPSREELHDRQGLR